MDLHLSHLFPRISAKKVEVIHPEKGSVLDKVDKLSVEKKSLMENPWVMAGGTAVVGAGATALFSKVLGGSPGSSKPTTATEPDTVEHTQPSSLIQGSPGGSSYANLADPSSLSDSTLNA